jgi:eukaryotic-like serine/threonine-protein kinase
VVIGSNNGILYAYDAKTGEPRWKVAAQSDIKTRATYDPKRRLVLFSALDGIFYAVRAQDGMPVHARELGAGTYSIPLVEGNTVYVSCLDKCVYAINLDTWSERWVFETAGRIFASPLLHGGSLWVGSNDGRLYEIDAGSGTRRSSHQFTERIVNRVVIRDNRIFVPTVANELYCIRKIV